MIALVDEHKSRWGVGPICTLLPIAPSTYYAARKRPPSDRALRDDYLKLEIVRVWTDNYKVYGADKIWRQLNRDGITVARCTVERLMHDLGIRGVTRGHRHVTTIPATDDARPADLVDRNFSAPAPNRLWVCDLTYVRTDSGFCYVAFVVDCYARMIVGWQASRSLRTDLALDALEQAIWTRRLHGLEDLVHHSDCGVQYLSIRYTERLAAAGIEPSVGSTGDSFDNALAESVIGLNKTELVRNLGPWSGLDDLELATLEWVDGGTTAACSARSATSPQPSSSSAGRTNRAKGRQTREGSPIRHSVPPLVGVNTVRPRLRLRALHVDTFLIGGKTAAIGEQRRFMVSPD
jgi:putative transposase